MKVLLLIGQVIDYDQVTRVKLESRPIFRILAVVKTIHWIPGHEQLWDTVM